jgi:uncharacterized membrane protein
MHAQGILMTVVILVAIGIGIGLWALRARQK